MYFVLIIYMCLFLIYALATNKIKRTKEADIILFIGFAISLAMLAYHFKISYDMYRHHLFIETIKRSRKDLVDLLLHPIWGWENYQFYIVFEILCYISAKIGNVHWLSAFMVLSDYIIFAYISVDWHWNNNSKGGYILTILLATVFIPFIHAVSGMRNATAAALTALAIYLYLEKEKGILFPATCLIIGMLIHPVVLMTVPFVILSSQKLTWKKILVVVITVISLQWIANLFMSSSLSFIKMLGKMYLIYSSPEQYFNSRRYLYADLICLVMFLFILLANWKHKREHSRLETFFVLYIIFVLGNIGNYDLVIRPSYLFAPLAAPLISMVYDDRWYFMDSRQGIVLKLCSKLILMFSSMTILIDVIYLYVYILENY